MVDLFAPNSAGLQPLPEVESREHQPEEDDPKFDYFPSDELVSAVKVAILLGRPLLITGAPGVGKTSLGDYLARQLTPGRKLLRFDVKSTTRESDIFYKYDHLLAFQDSHRQERKAHKHYMRFTALGQAILLAQSRVDADTWWCEQANGPFDGPRRSVVLIDEIDKAPRDVTNDLLNEIDKMFFRIAEAGFQEIRVAPNNRPVVIFASNSEKPLPEPFLRRCVYHHIAFPTDPVLDRIIRSRFPDYGPDKIWMKQAIRLFKKLRDPASGLRKVPGTAELLDWLKALAAQKWSDRDTLAGHSNVADFLGALIKTQQDRELVLEQLPSWLAGL